MRLKPIHTLSMIFFEMEFSIKLLYCMNYEASTAKSYISGLSFKMKVMAIQDTTKSFVITKMLSGRERMHTRVNARKPITF
jgi:hypothetical protein